MKNRQNKEGGGAEEEDKRLKGGDVGRQTEIKAM